MNRIAFEIFNFSITWYGIIIASSVLVGLLVAIKLCKIKGINPDSPFELLLWCFPLAIIGARTYFCMFSGDSYTFLEFIAIWNGGMAIYGGIIGGLIGLIIYSLVRKQNLLATLDIVAPCLIIGQALGRWGNFANQEVYGLEITDPNFQFFPFGVYIEKLSEWHYATFFYESILNVIGFLILYYLFRKNLKNGIVTSVYLVFYGTIRFFLELLRESTEVLYLNNTNIPVSCIVSFAMILIGSGFIIYSYIKSRKIKELKIE